MELNTNNWPTCAIEQWPIENVIPFDENARTHSRAQIQQIVASIQEWGWTNPILVDEGGRIIAGHGRLSAAHELSLVSVPVVIARGWSEGQKRAYCLADNQLALNAGWDLKRLRTQLSELEEWGFNTELVGFPEELNVSDEWKGMPEFNQTEIKAHKTLLVHFVDQRAVDQFAKLVDRAINPKTTHIWFPQIPDETYRDKRYEAVE